MIKLYQAEWCPFSHRIRAKLTELGIDYEAVNVSASAEKRAKLKEITGNSTIPVLVDGEKVFSDSSEILSYLEEEHESGHEELNLHQRELSPTIYGTLPFAVDRNTGAATRGAAGGGYRGNRRARSLLLFGRREDLQGAAGRG